MSSTKEFTSSERARKARKATRKEIDRLREEIGDEPVLIEIKKRSKTAAEAATSMALLNFTYERIASVLGFSSAGAARAAVESSIASVADSDGDKSKLRARMSLTLDQYHRAVYSHAMDPDDPDQAGYIKLGLAIVDRKIRLQGLDAPQVHYINPEGDQLDEYIRVLAIASGAVLTVEGDPFSEEVTMIQDEDGRWRPAEE